MKQIPLTNSDAVVYVDDVDYDFLIGLCGWGDDGKGYARSSRLFNGERVKIHRIIASRMGLDTNHMHVHHKDENTMNNCRYNLETKTASEHTRGHNTTRVFPNGDSHANTQWTDDSIIEVLDIVMRLGGTQREMAELLGMSVPHLGDIVQGRKRAYLQPRIQQVITDTNWRKGNCSNTDEETLELVRDFAASGLSITAFASKSGKISRQHLQNILAGKRLPHLYDRVRQIIG